MNTKLSVALLSGLSLFLSVGAFAVSDDSSSDYLNWSYAMGDLAPADKSTPSRPNVQPETNDRHCTAGCPSRPQTDNVEPLTLTYEDEAAPVIEQTETFSARDRFIAPAGDLKSARDTIAQSKGLPTSQRMPEQPPVVDMQTPPVVNTQYVESPAKVQYPITRQYPISVQYPVTVQRNMTVEQPVIMQQPVIVRRPVVMQQDITVQRQPTVIQHQPVVMQQQPTFVQQNPVTIQAPAQPINPMTLSSFEYMPQPMGVQPFNQFAPGQQIAPQPVMQQVSQPVMQPAPYMSVQPMFQQPQPGVSQQYYVQGQVMAQPVYVQRPYSPVQQPTEAVQQPAQPTTY